MKPDEYKTEVSISTASSIQTLLSHKARIAATGGTEPNSVDMLVHREMRAIRALGYDRKLPSHDELRSEKKLLRFIETHRTDRSQPPMEELRGVRDREVFFALRQKVDDWHARRAAGQKAYADWKEEVGDVSRDDLLEDGWIPFLESLDGPDIFLWHGVATDFHDIEIRDRLGAAFWVLEQPDCDRATASDFIVNFIEYKLDRAKTDAETLRRFADVTMRYNAGFYRYHSIRPETGPKAMFRDETLDAAMTRMAGRATGGMPEASPERRELEALHASLPRPVGLLELGAAPTDGYDRHVSSGYAFWDDAGLHLAYPGEKARRSS